jgi:hypothetical protein
MSNSGTVERGKSGGEREDPKALRESREPTVSKPGGFKNDPDDPTNPCEAIERTRRTSLNPKSKSSGSGDPHA